MREQFVKSGEWKLTNSKIEKSLEVFNKYQTGSNRKNNTQYSGKCDISNFKSKMARFKSQSIYCEWKNGTISIENEPFI